MIDRNQCCGCEACKIICPVSAINMVEYEDYFLYPQINEDKCIHCGKCENVCPCKNENQNKYSSHPHFVKAFSGFVNDKNSIFSVASGGASTALAEEFLSTPNSFVYGVSYTEDFKSACYREIDNKNNLDSIRGSKYIQSEKNDVYAKVLMRLKNGSRILFVGLPCEVVALKKFLGKYGDSDNLYTADLICYAPTTAKIQAEYVEYLERKLKGKLSKFSVRDKTYGWECAAVYAESINGKKYCEKRSNTEFGVAFINYSRESCMNCKFKGDNRLSDITLGDYWGIKKDDSMYNEMGVSIIFVHSNKGMKIIDLLRDFSYEEADLQYARSANCSIDLVQCIPEKRKQYIERYRRKGLIKAAHTWNFYVNKYISPSLLKQIKRIVRSS